MRRRCEGADQSGGPLGDPVIFLEHKGLYRKIQAKTLEPDAEYVLPLGRGRVWRSGNDLTVITSGSTVFLALEGRPAT